MKPAIPFYPCPECHELVPETPLAFVSPADVLEAQAKHEPGCSYLLRRDRVVGPGPLRG